MHALSINLLFTADGECHHDITEGTYTFHFNNGSRFSFGGCTSNLHTTIDDVLEGDHSFFVTISDIRPDGALTVRSPAITEITINDLNGTYSLMHPCTILKIHHCIRDSALLLSFLLTCHPCIPFHYEMTC